MATGAQSHPEARAAMTHRERFAAALRGEAVDRPPIGLWRHFPGQDESVEGLVAATVGFQQEYDFDLVKLMPTGMYAVIDYGVIVRTSPDDIGTTRFVDGPIREPADWARLPEANPQAGTLSQQVEVVRQVRQALGPDTPIIQTIFTPITLAAKLAGGTAPLREAIAADPAALAAGLDRLAQDTIAFAQACLNAGADGFFVATQQATAAELPRAEFDRFGTPFDLRVLESLRPGASHLVLHLHGAEPYFDLVDAYPVDAVNWHDRETTPTLAEALSLTKRALVGGLERRGVIAHGTPEQVVGEVHDAIAQTNGHHLVIAPSCVLPFATPTENLHAARQAVEPRQPV